MNSKYDMSVRQSRCKELISYWKFSDLNRLNLFIWWTKAHRKYSRCADWKAITYNQKLVFNYAELKSLHKSSLTTFVWWRCMFHRIQLISPFSGVNASNEWLQLHAVNHMIKTFEIHRLGSIRRIAQIQSTSVRNWRRLHNESKGKHKNYHCISYENE